MKRSTRLNMIKRKKRILRGDQFVEVTLLGNGSEYSDWDIQAIVFINANKLRELMIEFFLISTPKKIVDPERPNNFFLLWNQTQKEFCDTNKRWISQDSSWVSSPECLKDTTLNDAKMNYRIIERKKFLLFLSERGIVYIDNPDCVG